MGSREQTQGGARFGRRQVSTIFLIPTLRFEPKTLNWVQNSIFRILCKSDIAVSKQEKLFRIFVGIKAAFQNSHGSDGFQARTSITNFLISCVLYYMIFGS